MKTKIITIALSVIFAIGNIGYSFGKIYKNVVEDKENNITTISFYEGNNDIVETPIKQYQIRYSDKNQPVEKILYTWDKKKMTWALSEKYEYLYDESGRPQTLMHCEWNKKANAWSPEVEYEFYVFDVNKELLSVNDLK